MLPVPNHEEVGTTKIALKELIGVALKKLIGVALKELIGVGLKELIGRGIITYHTGYSWAISPRMELYICLAVVPNFSLYMYSSKYEGIW